jgi:hypothetical protein
MRRVWGSILLGLGVFLIVAAGMIRFYAVDKLVVIPKDQYSVSVAPGTGSYFDPGTLQVRPSGDIVARRRVRGDVGASNGTTGVWDVSLVLETGDGTFVRAVVDRVAFDRKTGESVHCCGEAIDSTPVPHEGYSYKLPFDLKKQDYLFWDPNSSAAYPAKFDGDDTVQGLKVYRFVQDVPGHEIRKEDVPGSVVGESAPSVNAPVWYTNRRTIWVEPATGIIVKGREQTHVTLRNLSNEDKVVALDVDVQHDDPTQRELTELARDTITDIRLAKWYLPIGAVVIGLGFIALAATMLRRSDDGGESEPAAKPAEEPVST